MELFSRTPKVESLKSASERLVQWFKQNKRALPWRVNQSPYKTLVSEIMLQQTTVKTVVPKFETFIERFPHFKMLAQASVEEVLSLWEGLGYYRRARNLHQCAKQVVQEFQGELPQSTKELKQLKGIGPYTAGAIASLAFGQRESIVDGNVVRVFSRYFGCFSALPADYWGIAQQWVEQSQHPALHNEGLMELGALVCTPTDPQCKSCPLQNDCFAYQNARVDVFPPQQKRMKQRKTNRIMVLLTDREYLFVTRVPEGQLCENQWSGWLSEPFELESDFEIQLSTCLSSLSARGGHSFAVTALGGHFTHSVYNERMKIYVVQCLVNRSCIDQSSGESQWARITALPRPQSTLLRKSLALLQMKEFPRPLLSSPNFPIVRL